MFNWPKFIFPGGLPRTNKSNRSKFKHWMESQTPAGLTIPANSVADPSSAGVTGARQVNHTTSTTKSHSADLLCTCPRCLHLTALSLLLWAWEKFWSCHSYILCPFRPLPSPDTSWYLFKAWRETFRQTDPKALKKGKKSTSQKYKNFHIFHTSFWCWVAWVCAHFLYINKATLNMTGLMMSFSSAYTTN